MAIRKMNEGVSNWNKGMPFPKDRYVVRCIEESFKPSAKGHPMITRKFEIVAPEVVQIGDKQVSVVGATILQYAMTKIMNEDGTVNAEKSEKAFGRFRDDLTAMGFKGTEIDDENPPMENKGKCFNAIVYGKEDQQRKSLTNEQRAAGERAGDPILDDNGKPVIAYVLNIDQILGVAAGDVGQGH